MSEEVKTNSENEEGQEVNLTLTKIVESVAGKDADHSKMDWVSANISSIRETIKDGKHSTLYYPASGIDIIRPLYAYAVVHLIVVDNDKNRIGEAGRQLEEIGVKTNVQTTQDGKKLSLLSWMVSCAKSQRFTKTPV